jgi:uncharacterized membrane protein YhfC
MSSPPSALFLLSGLGMMVVGAAAVLFWLRRTAASWAAFGLGALAWAVGVALKIGWAVPTNRFIQEGFQQFLPGWMASAMFCLYVGLLTGVFECGIAFLFVKRTRLKAAEWNEAIAFGIGSGAVEAFLLGLLNFVGIAAAIVFWEVVPEEARTALATEFGPGITAIPIPVVERLTALLAHTFARVLIVYGVRVGRGRWFWLSFAYMTALDGFAAWGMLETQLTKSVSGLARFEAAVGIYAVVGLAGIALLRRRFASLEVGCIVDEFRVEPQTKGAKQ